MTYTQKAIGRESKEIYATYSTSEIKAIESSIHCKWIWGIFSTILISILIIVMQEFFTDLLK